MCYFENFTSVNHFGLAKVLLPKFTYFVWKISDVDIRCNILCLIELLQDILSCLRRKPSSLQFKRDIISRICCCCCLLYFE